MKYYVLLTLFWLFNSHLLSAQKHPTSEKPGCCGVNTNNLYTYNKEDEDNYLLIYASNRASEQDLFYEGKFDVWEANKDNPLIKQIYLIPTGALPIETGQFLDQTEVTNIDYQEFLFYIKKDSGLYKDKAYQPELENKFRINYFQNPEFYFYPVVGVRHKNAEAYCEWRAQQLNLLLVEKLQYEVRKYIYHGRLPNLEEWKKAAGHPAASISEKTYKLDKKAYEFLDYDIVSNRFAKPYIFEKRSYIGYNKNLKGPSGDEFALEVPAYVYSFEPDSRGFYNLYGNVKEIVQEGYAIGGSFQTPFSADALFEKEEVHAYRTDVGFRCLTEVTRKK
ncbi:formylglycine-generating enzyme family protein [Reichenbachiella ulvae]|uniref:Formylglycine-generating enzyme family protein n=1 Tax=Reichenbachiella ulvae TaxID=2980104 RepID=A0ABT3CNL8_9BACT|nr:formylglycine-generating enzyme family protein [Reichenbachiella ulvae]MCV9385192.1 formylglycine-generating enzyme family protein [Reichenbachiella ulvae]